MTHNLSQNIFSILGLEDAPQEEKRALLDQVAEETMTAFFKRIEDRLPEDRREELYRLFETQTSDEEKAKFFAAYAPDAANILVEEITRIKREAGERGAMSAKWASKAGE